MDIEKVHEIHKRCNGWFYGFDSQISINDQENAISLKIDGNIEIELCRINFAMFLSELIEDIEPGRVSIDFSQSEIARDDFVELIIEIALVFFECNIGISVSMKKDVTKKSIFKDYSEIFVITESDGKVNMDVNSSYIGNFINKANINKDELIDNWKTEFMIATINNEKPGIEYKYHHRMI